MRTWRTMRAQAFFEANAAPDCTETMVGDMLYERQQNTF